MAGAIGSIAKPRAGASIGFWPYSRTESFVGRLGPLFAASVFDTLLVIFARAFLLIGTIWKPSASGPPAVNLVVCGGGVLLAGTL